MATNQAGSYVALEMTERKRASEASLRVKNDDEVGGELDEVFWTKVLTILFQCFSSKLARNFIDMAIGKLRTLVKIAQFISLLQVVRMWQNVDIFSCLLRSILV